MFDYSRQLRPDEAQVHLLDHEGHPGFPAVREQIAAAARAYGFTLTAAASLDPWPADPPITGHRLLLVLASGPFDQPLVDTLLTDGLRRYSIISIAFRYRDEGEMRSYAELVDKYKRLAEDRINFLRPCPLPGGELVVPPTKLVDNAICDSVRIKYRPVNLDPAPIALDAGLAAFFTRASDLFEQHRLYHRSASDGYFAARTPGDPGFYITATKSYKDPLDLRRVVRVERYDEADNTLRFRGAYLPSSDAVEASIVFARNPEVASVVHTHASTWFTRNPRFRERVLVGRERYGEPRLGHLVHQALDGVEDGFVIMEDHGEVFAHNAPEVSPTLLSHLPRP
ncbi:class II aldolase/adducin family protein [Amycolatopsis circi]|uniref:class II aldolase/adducin family protein n=1 Tax=Amycolatopsis circi TaxID=871959 RepID=UPI000E26BFB9|nr:class II aldolase/adducin family protein [Amycolatopsis circi]